MSLLRPLESFIGMFHCSHGMLVCGLVIFFPVVRGGSTVGVCGEFVEFGSSLVRVIWHCFSHSRWPLHLSAIPFSKLSSYEHSRRGFAGGQIVSHVFALLGLARPQRTGYRA